MTLLLFAVALNLAGAAFSVAIAWHNHRRLQAVLRDLQASPHWACIEEGHDFELDVLTLEDQSKPPYFGFTHVFRWTCRRCETEYTKTQRMVMVAPPGTVEVESSWLNLEGEETDAC